MIIIPKIKPVTICEGLSNKEFRCKCNNHYCKCTMIHPDFIEAYEKFRAYVGMPLEITSGFRCPERNSLVGGKPLSYHQAGMAIDIIAKNLINKYRSNIQVEKIALQCGFKFVKYYIEKGIFHMDVRG